jgi:hypothetical protein
LLVVLLFSLLLPSAAGNTPASVQFDLAAAPQGRTLLLATPTGVYRSVDTGRHWEPTGLAAPSVLAVYAVPQPAPAFGWAPTQLTFYAVIAGAGIQESRDEGLTWSQVAASTPGEAPTARLQAGELAPFAVRKLLPDPAAPRTLYALSDGGALWRSRDGHWEQIERPSPARALAVRRGGLEGAAVQFGCGCGGLLAGDTVSILYLLDATGIHRSFDHGTSWSALPIEGVQPDEMAALAFNPTNETELFAVLADGRTVLRSLDSGYTWHLMEAKESRLHETGAQEQ